MGPLEQTKPWNTNGVEGVFRFLNRVWRCFIADDGTLQSKIRSDGGTDAFKRTMHRTIKKLTEDYEALRFNTAISQMMIFINEAYKQETLPLTGMRQFVQLLSPIAPHIAEELWEKLGGAQSLTFEPWPVYDEQWTLDEEVEIVIQVNGKIIDRMNVAVDTEVGILEASAVKLDKVQEAMIGKQIRKVIAVKNKLVNIVAG
jgi:leucyl-tRNA synthetase